MAVNFDRIRNNTVNIKCAKEFKIKSVVYENQLVAMLLCITTDIRRLPPYMLFPNAKPYLRTTWFIKTLLCMHKE
jgi:hypothetical protein